MLHKGWIDPTDRIDMRVTYVSRNSEKNEAFAAKFRSVLETN